MTDARARVDALVDGPSSWSRLEHLGEVASTNDVVLERVRGGGPAGLVVVADRQTAGRGRHGRTWEDRPGASLLVSAATGVPSRGATLVPLAAGLAVGDALRRGGLPVQLKWPNDVLVHGRKIAGILVEGHDLRPEGPRFLVIGIGVNVDWRGRERDPALPWTSMAEELDADVDRWDVLHDLLRSLEAWLLDVPGDPTRLLAAYTIRSCTLGTDVEVTLPGDRVVAGRAVDLDASGGLVLDTPAGRQVVVAGEVRHVA